MTETDSSAFLSSRRTWLAGRVGRWLAGLSDPALILLLALALFALAAWPLLLVDLPPFQDLPNHAATAHIIAHPELYPQYTFNGLFKSNALLTLWFYFLGGHGIFGAARAFTAVVLATSALALPIFVLHFAGRRALLVAACFFWPFVHSFSVTMGFLNFAFAFALSLILLVLLDGRGLSRRAPGFGGSVAVVVLSIVIWYAHPFPLAVVGGLVALHVVTRLTWRTRVDAGIALLGPLVPAGLLAAAAARQHLVKAENTTAAAAVFSYLNPWELLAHLWTDVSGAFTWWGSMTIAPALLLPYYAWKGRRTELPFLSGPAMGLLAAAYVGLPVMLSNWWYLNCRLVPFLWAGLLLRVRTSLPRPVAMLLVLCALAFSAVTGLDYLRLDHERAAFTAGVDAVPPRATLLPLMFERSKTSVFTASLNHAWGYYTVAKDTSAPLAFAVERSYPITYREFPPRAVIPPALDRFAERNATPARVCKVLRQSPGEPVCATVWREVWASFWREAEPRFSHLLTWAIPPEAREIIPDSYQRIFAEGELEIYRRVSRHDVAPPPPGS